MATTTKHGHHHSHPTAEPTEHDTYKFVYEPQTHKMVIVTGKECYVFSLTDAERVSVHTDAGIKAIELRLLTAITSNAVVATTKDQLDTKSAHICGGHTTTFYTQTSA